MNSRTTHRTWHVLSCALPVLAIAAMTTTAMAGRPIIHVGPEVAAGGQTAEQFVAEQTNLLTELITQMPDGAMNKPVRVGITQADRDDLAAPAANGAAPLRIGVVKAVSGVEVVRGQAFKHGVTEETEDGFVWSTSVTSPDAQAIRVQFRNFSLPTNVEMYFFGEDTIVDGPYTGAGRNGTGDFWTRSIGSETGIIMVRSIGPVSDAERRQISFVLANVGHINGRPPQKVVQTHDSWPCSDNASCVVDASCGNLGPAAPAADAIAKMEWTQGPYIYTCTGGLLADTDAGSTVPLFLTANHCISKSSSNMEFFFNYATTSCNGDCPDSLVTGGNPPAPSVVGFTKLASGRSGDFTLGQLNQSPPGGAVYLGWTNAPIANTDGAGLYRVSNPNFGPQAYSQHDVDANAVTCTGWPRGERIYSADITGATMGGSSGSPVLNSASEVVGQLSGCCGYNCGDVCDAASNSTVDGALAHYYDNVAAYLDPQGGGGGCTSDGECDDGDACNGAETCVSGSCQNGTPPACQNGDGCCPSGCTSGNDDDCSGCTGGQAGDPCVDNADCCSNSCKGKPGAKTCK